MLQSRNNTEKNHVSQNNLPMKESNKHHRANATLIEGYTITFQLNLKALFQGFNEVDLSQHDLVELEMINIIDNEFVSINVHLIPKLDYE